MNRDTASRGDRTSWRDVDATRYLCAGAWLDEEFADAVLAETVTDQRRAMAPSLGVDLVPVVEHCLAANRDRTRRYRAATAVLVVGLVLSPLAMVFGGLLAWAVSVLVGVLAGVGRDGVGQTRRVNPPGSTRFAGLTLGAGVVLAVLAAFSPFAPLLRGLVGLFVQVGGSPLVAGPGGTLFEVPAPAGTSTVGQALVVAGGVAGLGWLGLFGILAAGEIRTRGVLCADLRTRPRSDAAADLAPSDLPDSATWPHRQLAELRERQRGNLTVCRGRQLFVGAGTPLSTWSLTVPLRARPAGVDPLGRAVDVGPAPLVSAVRLHRRVIRGLHAAADRVGARADPGALTDEPGALTDEPGALTDEPGALTELGGIDEDLLGGRPPWFASRSDAETGPQPLPDLTVEERALVSDAVANQDARVQVRPGGAPRARLSAAELRALAEGPSGPMRHYLCVHARDRGGGLVVSSYLHLTTDGATLTLECQHLLLPPIRSRYRVVDTLRPRPPRLATARAAFTVAPQLVPWAVGAPGWLLRARLARLARLARGRRPTRGRTTGARARNGTADGNGARRGVRELGARPAGAALCSARVVTRHREAVERIVLRQVLEVLDEAGVDTTELRERQRDRQRAAVVGSADLSPGTGPVPTRKAARAARGAPNATVILGRPGRGRHQPG